MKGSDASRKFVRQPKKPIVMSTPSNLQVLYEDNHIIAVNKRSSDVVQGDGKGDKSLCEVVAEYVAKKYNKPGKAFIGTVHRLDRPVSESSCTQKPQRPYRDLLLCLDIEKSKKRIGL